MYTTVIPQLDTSHVKVTSTYPSGTFHGWQSCNPNNRVTGEWDNACWVANGATNQRFHVDLVIPQVITRIQYQNGHWFGQNTSSIQNFTLWGSNTQADFDDLVYANDGTWVQLTTSQSAFDQHSASDAPDIKTIQVTNTTPYRYYAIKCADNYGNATLMAMRRIEFQVEKSYTSVYPTQDTDHVKATTTNTFNNNWKPWYATDPTKPVTGTDELTSWLSDAWVTNVNQRFHIDLGTAQVIKRVYFENMFAAGIPFVADRGMKNFTLWGSNDAGAFAELTYGVDTNWTQIPLNNSLLLIHSTTDQSEPQYTLADNTTAYRYYAFKFPDNYGRADGAGFRRVELQTEDAPTTLDLPILHWNIVSIVNNTTVYSDPASWNMNQNNGVPPYDLRYGFFQVDLSQLPPGAVITGAMLHYHFTSGAHGWSLLPAALGQTYDTNMTWATMPTVLPGSSNPDGTEQALALYEPYIYGYPNGTTWNEMIVDTNVWHIVPQGVTTPDMVLDQTRTFIRVTYYLPPPIPSFGKINGMEYGDINKVEGVAISTIDKIMGAVIGH